MLIFAGPEVLMDAGRWDDARALLDDAHRVAASSGSVAYQGFCWVIEAKLALRRGRDATAARAALAQPACRRACGAFRFIDEVADTWMGLAELVSGSPETARAVLERATDGMRAGDRILELPTAAVYLAEALSRCGDERAADGAADLALHTARRQGSDHLLLQALADFPAVASRRLEAEAGADSEWHALGQAMSLQHVRPGATGETTVELAEFGRRALSVSGMEVKPRIAKSYELLAYLVVVPDRTAPREDLLQALFDDRRDDAARAYLRQAIHQLREALPGGALRTENGQVALDGELTVASESVTVERALAEAARRQGADRLRASLAAIAVYDRGEYLPGPRAGWADARQQRLAELVTQARYQAAVLSFGAGDYELAERLAGDVLHADPFHEAAWRVRMRIARARGDEEGVLRAYHACEAALAAIPAGPSQSTRALLARERVAARA
jgi:DNA-binding SARP family transcriptional activator